MKLNLSVLDLLIGLIVLAGAGIIIAGINYVPVGQDASIFYASTEAGGVNQFFIDSGIYDRAIYGATLAGELDATHIGEAVEKEYKKTMEKIHNSGHWNDEATKELRRRLSLCKLVVEYEGQKYSFNLKDVYNLYDGDREGEKMGYYPSQLDENKAVVVATNSVAYTTINGNDVIFRVYYIVPK